MHPSYHAMPISIALLPLDARPAAALATGNFASTAILRRAGVTLTGLAHDPQGVWHWCLTRAHAARRA